MTFEEVKEMFKKSIDATDTMNQALENLIQSIYLKGYNEALEQKPRWIPVSERLPNLDDYTGPKIWQKKVLITGYLSFCDEKDLFVTEAFASDVVYNRVWDTVVVAWMPLPKPYKEV